MDYRPQGSYAHGIFQSKILEWLAIFYSRGSSQTRIEPASLASPALAGGFFIPLSHLKVKVDQSCPTICSPMYYTVHEILQARIPYSGHSLLQGPSQLRD